MAGLPGGQAVASALGKSDMEGLGGHLGQGSAPKRLRALLNLDTSEWLPSLGEVSREGDRDL